MKTIILFFTICCCPVLSMAQEVTKRKEAGLISMGLGSFGFTYRTGKEKAVWRFNTLSSNGSFIKRTSNQTGITSNSVNLSASFGREKRKEVLDRLELRYGIDLTFSYNNFKNASETKTNGLYSASAHEVTYSPGIDLVLGVNYLITDRLVIGAELRPGINYLTGKRTATIIRNNTDIEKEELMISGIE